MELSDYADRGVLLSALSDAERERLILALEQTLPDQFSEPVIGFSSILLVGAERKSVERWLIDLPSSEETKASNDSVQHTLKVCYDGPDLNGVAEACGLSVETVVEKHSRPIYTVRMMGFSPGFPYLDGLDPDLHLDRRSSPRNHIRPGTVAIGGPHAGIYSVASPGGWHLLGSIKETLFDTEAARQRQPRPDEIFALKIGDRVQFEPEVLQ